MPRKTRFTRWLWIIGLIMMTGWTTIAAQMTFTLPADTPPTLTTAIMTASLSPNGLDELWDQLVQDGRIPYIEGEQVAFLYRGEARSIAWLGDFNGWSPRRGLTGMRLPGTDWWIATAQFPTDARLDYKIYRNNSEWLLDPANPYQQVGGFGANSELRMPDWVYPADTLMRPNTPLGTSTDWIVMESDALGYDVAYRVFVPYGYDEGEDRLPTLYVLDGHEYASDEQGALIMVLDNLIAEGRIAPVIAVFIDPRNPANRSQNRRMSEYMGNPDFAAFVSTELVPVIDAAYRTDPTPERRGILGTSLGGQMAAYIGATHADTFGLIGIQSPALTRFVMDAYTRELQPVSRIFLSSGTPTMDADIRTFERGLEQQGYNYMAITVNEGHSWGNWRALVDEMLIFFFPANP